MTCSTMGARWGASAGRCHRSDPSQAAARVHDGEALHFRRSSVKGAVFYRLRTIPLFLPLRGILTHGSVSTPMIGEHPIPKS
jgi:hypothetical protein